MNNEAVKESEDRLQAAWMEIPGMVIDYPVSARNR